MGDLDRAKDICSKCGCIQDWNTMKPDEDINNFNIYCDNCYENKDEDIGKVKIPDTQTNTFNTVIQLTRIADALENKTSITLYGKVSEHNKYSNNFVSKNEQS